MAEYNYTKPGINKITALDSYFRNNFLLYDSYNYSDPYLTIYTTQTLTPTEESNLNQLVIDYVDPPDFLVLSTTITDSSRSHPITSTVPEVASTFIFSPVNPIGESIFNAIKTVLEISTNDVTLFSTGSTSATVTLDIYDLTRDVNIGSVTIDITDILDDWQTQAQNNETGSRSRYKTVQIEGLRNTIANYDCIHQILLSSSNTNVTVTAHSKQSLYYDVF